MKHFLLFIILASISIVNTARANNAAAGELTYTWLRDSTYAIKFTYFNDCKGNAAPTNVTLCVNNTCNNTSFTRSMAKYSGNIRNNTVTNGSEISFGCTQHAATVCTNPNSTIFGYREWVYTDTVTLPSRCANWTFSISLSGRNTSFNLANGNFFIQAVINNTTTQQNSSPEVALHPIIFACVNQPINVNLKATDPDGDSLFITTVHPQTTTNTNNCPLSASNIGINAWVQPPFNLANNPINTNNTYSLNGSTQQLSFTAAGPVSNQSLSFKIDEYRNGIKIGSILREMQVNVHSCPGVSAGQLTTDSVIGAMELSSWAGILYGCSEQQMDWYFHVTNGLFGSLYSLSSDIQASLPNATLDIINQNSDTVFGHFKWTPTINDRGYNSFILTIGHDVCYPPSLKFRYLFNIDINIIHPISLGNDTAICAHESINLTPKGGLFSYTWQMLPGSAGTLSCSQCNSPTVKPAPVAEYVVTSSADWCPHVYSDTIKVSTLDVPITYPAVNIVAAQGVNVWQWLEVKFTAATVNCNTPSYQWMLNNEPIPGANSNTWSSTTLADGDSVYCVLSCNDTCPDPRMLSSNILRMNVATSVEQVAQNMPFSLYPNPNNGTFTLQLKDEKPATIAVINTFGQVIHTREINGSEVISLPNIVQGIYTIRLHHNGQTYSTRFTRL